MGVIFLDIDGVLNHGKGKIVPEKVELINQLKDHNFVISSDWRYAGLDNVKFYLAEAGFEGSVVGSTPVDFNSRASQILEYLKENPTSRYAILDDNELGFVEEENNLADHLIKTNSKTGITQEDIDLAKNLL